VYTWIGPKWGRGAPPRFTPEFVVGYTRQVTANQGVVTWDVPFDEKGLIQKPYMRILEALAAAVPPERSVDACQATRPEPRLRKEESAERSVHEQFR